MVFLYLNKVSRPTFGGEIQLKGHGFSLAPGGRDGFSLFQILKILRGRIMGRNNDNFYRVAKWIYVLPWYILFPGQKYLSSIVVFHSLVAERPFYCQSSSHYRPFYLNGEYRYLRLLPPCCTHDGYSCTYLLRNQTERR